ncbi:Granzyme B [Chelonia mydas]|uniref:Granzyme B n=1 Tax=Chelonia mydas TaxID=8469 RepID=M7AMH2_CHEMY|nr:Granzyme B [Chelonia mydas]
MNAGDEIIGGREAKPHSRRYMAYLQIQDGQVKKKCGGFLVKTNFVLTAAHCQGDKITVKLGAHNISEQERSQQKIPVLHQIPHQQYDKKTLNNDIMLLQWGAEHPLIFLCGCFIPGAPMESAPMARNTDIAQEVNAGSNFQALHKV